MFDFSDNETGLFEAIDDVERVADVWELFETYHVNGFTWVGDLNGLAFVIGHHSNAAVMDTTHEDVFQVHGAPLYNHGGSDLSRFLVDIRFNDDALRWHSVVLNQVDALSRYTSYLLLEHI